MYRRVLELLSGDWTLSSQLRVPAISRMQKVHNVGVTFAALTKTGADMDSLKGRIFFVSGCGYVDSGTDVARVALGT